MESRRGADDPDNGGCILFTGKQFLRLELAEGAVEAAVWFDHGSELRQIVEHAMHRTTVDEAGGGIDRLELHQRVLGETRQVSPHAGWFYGRGRGQLTGRHQKLIGVGRVVLELTGPEGVGPGAEEMRSGIDRTQNQLLLLHRCLDGKLQQRDRFEKRRAPLFQPLIPLDIAARLTGGDHLVRLEPHTDKRMGMAKPQPEHAAGIVQPQRIANAPGMADRTVGTDVLMALVDGVVGPGQQEEVAAPALPDMDQRRIFRGPGV